VKPILLKITNTPNHSFSVEEHKGRAFNYPYHFHPEYELTLIIKGKGTRFVGNNISSFDPSDLVLIGKNLPHHWHSDQADEQEKSSSVRAIVLKFASEFNGIRLFDLPENHQIRQLLEASAKGLKIVGKTFSDVAALMELLLVANGPERILLLLRILNEIAVSDDLEVISNSDYPHHITEHDMDRMNKVYEYILDNYLGSVSLSQAAAIANMHESAFCKYFKRRYAKTFIQVVSEIRISHACRQLNKTDITVAEVCYQSGFNNLSNFTKIFRKIMNMSPKEYQKQMSPKNL
jgi:AraC-like DNA-binding protein